MTPELKHAWALGLLAVPLLLLLLAVRHRRRRPALVVSSLAFLTGPRPSLRARLGWVGTALRLAALIALALAIARPRAGERFQDVITHGVDMVIALDTSGSMKAEDFLPKNRLHVAKDVVRRFIDSRHQDRLGLVAFAGQAITRCPLTLDYGLLKGFLETTWFDAVERDGTAIGLALGTSLNRLRRSTAKSKVVVLVTDGINNQGAIDPFTAAEMARTLGVRVYTVGVGTRGVVRIPVLNAFGRTEYAHQELPLDEDALRRIATVTGGYYFRATDTASFEEALERIGKLETTEVETREYVLYDEHFLPLITMGAALLALEALLAATWLRRLP